jgi:hypothetical protein
VVVSKDAIAERRAGTVIFGLVGAALGLLIA